MNIRDRFFRALGLEPRRPEPVVKNEPGTDPDDVAAAAGRTGKALREPDPPLEPSRELRGGMTTDDIDRDTGRPYPDYLTRRVEREAARHAAAEGAPASIVSWDISPK